MTAESMQDIISQCGLEACALESDGLPQLQPDEQFSRTFEPVSLIAGGEHDLGSGALHFTTKRVIWAKGEQTAAVAFRGISMHALSRDADFYQKPCIYCQLDEPDALAQVSDDDVVCSHEIMLVPQDTSAIDAVFEALCAGAEANPDAMEADEGNFFFDAASAAAGMDAAGAAQLQALEQRLQLPTAAEFDGLVAEGADAEAAEHPEE